LQKRGNQLERGKRHDKAEEEEWPTSVRPSLIGVSLYFVLLEREESVYIQSPTLQEQFFGGDDFLKQKNKE
jgi:hypothetical protein